MSKVTIKDIAAMTDVSIGTVSRIINNTEKGYSTETRDKVLKAIKESGYTTNEVARGLVTKKTKTIGVIVPDILNPFFPEIVRGAEDGASKRGYSIILCNSDNNPNKEIEYIKLLKSKYVDGIVFCTNLFQDNFTEGKRLIGDTPIVMTDSFYVEEGQYALRCDDMVGGYIATKYLLSLGHKRIACITGPNNTTSSPERLKGYEKALNEAGIKFDYSLIYEGNYRIDGGVKGVEALKNKGCTAIFVYNDLMAYGVYKKLFDMGLNIPNDVSIIGYDDITFSQFVYPTLTSINQPSYQMGKDAVNILIDTAEGKKIKKTKIKYKPTLIIRDSTKKLGGM